MKNLLLFLFFLFLFFQKINGQVEPRLVEKLTEEYSESLNKWVEKIQEIYKYDFRGNKIEYAIITYSLIGEIESWEGIKYEYDTNDLLQKETVRRYNWEVGIWVNEYWIDYFYDENGCVEERHRLYNLEPINWIEIAETEDNCLEKSYTLYHVDANDSLVFGKTMKFAYDDRNRIFYSKLSIYVYDNFIGERILISEISEQGFNDQNDRTFLRQYWIDSVGFRTSLDDFYLNEYEYEFYLNNKIERKFISRYRYDPSVNPDTLAKGTKEILYEYSCDGLIVKEEITDSRYVITGDTLYVHQRCFYTYEGEDSCFDFDNKSTATIYPNPTAGEIQIESPLFESGNTQIKVLDVNGRVLLEKLIYSRETKHQFDGSGLPNGTYIFHLLSGKHFVSKKIVIIK